MRLTVLPSYSTIVFLLLFFTACKAKTVITADTKIDSIVVHKQDRLMLVYKNKTLLKTYKIALGRQPKGHKQYQGDMRTPEGLYYINGKNPNSTCHKNLGISYPNDTDQANAKKLNKSAGGDIKIHGLPNGQGRIGKLHILKDWTYGCIAVTDEEMDELYKHVGVGIPINIQP